MDRRSFIKVSGAVAATGLIGSCGQAVQRIIPHVVPPDEGINPVEGWFFATTCRMCEAGCGIIVRTVDGRAKKVEGNPLHPVNYGGVCARGQAAVQQLYHPDRVRNPMKRVGKKGTNSFEPVSWEEAINMLADKIKKTKGMFVMAQDATDVTSAVANGLLKKKGSGDFVVPNISGVESYMAASGILRSGASLPYYDISQAEFVLLLGADIFESGFSPVHYGWAYGEMRRGDPMRRGVMMYAGPRVSMTASVADHFIGTNPGELGILVLGITNKVLQVAIDRRLLGNKPRASIMRWLKALEEYSPKKVSEKTGVAEKTIAMIAHRFVEDAPALAVAGDDVAAHTNGDESLNAVELLNMLSREIAREKGSLKPLRLPQPDATLKSDMKEHLGITDSASHFSRYKKVLEKARGNGYGLGIIINTDPLHTMPSGLKAGDALSNVEFIAYAGCFLNDTTRYADLILPDHHFLESWSAQSPSYPAEVPMFNLQQPVVNPIYDTRPTADLLIEVAKKAGIDIGIENSETLIKETIVKFRARWSDLSPTLDDTEAWEFLLQRGGYWPETMTDEIEPAPTSDQLWDSAEKINVTAPIFSGGGEFPFHLHPYQTVTMGDGRTANIPWLQEMPEPMTTLMWGFWVEINPRTAEKLEIKNGDVLEIVSPGGRIEAPAHIYPGIGPEMLAVPFGYGQKSGRYSAGRGANVLELFDGELLSGSGALAWRGLKVKISKTGRRVTMVRAGNSRGEYFGEVFQL